ncbi:unnamed protein product [Schistosoma rodhaini]|uniref:C2 domain-containing protein n=1 Tax=Schistosoma rodhaini TaxID=6188 RepID=A0A183R1V0_9TREM|nr:unnamed protein product [Schistosoma rodhaini]CAH8661858.1 unnamed protein product [Schistosoma rodhaini]
MFHTDLLAVIFLCFVIFFIALWYLIFYPNSRQTMKGTRRVKSMNKQSNNKNARKEIARLYSFDKNAYQEMNLYSCGISTTEHSEYDSFGDTSLKSVKEMMRYKERQQRYSLQQMSSYQSNENDQILPVASDKTTRLIFGLQNPPLNITKLQMVQPDCKMVTKKGRLLRAFSESCTTKCAGHTGGISHENSEISNNKKSISTDKKIQKGIHLPKLSDSNLAGNLHLWLNSTKFNKSLFRSEKSLSLPSESVWSEVKRRLSSTEKVFDPVMRILSTVPLNNQTDLDNNTWTNFTTNPDTNGHICFSLAYTCTVGILNVTINRLIGVSNLVKNSNILPSQTSTNFVVSLRLRHNKSSTIYIAGDDEDNEGRINSRNKSEGFHKNYFTQPVSTSLNPSFDQSFLFSVTVNELDSVELVLAVFQSTTVNEFTSLNNNRMPRRNNSVVSYHHSYPYGNDRCLRRVNMISEEMRCIGVTFYKLNQHELINCPEKMQNIWQELRKLPEFQSRQTKIANCDNNDSMSDSTNYKVYPFTTENQFEDGKTLPNVSSEVPQIQELKKSLVKVTIQYKIDSSIFDIFIEEMKNVKILKNETEMMFQALFCLGNTTLSVVRCKPIRLDKTKPSDEEKSTDQNDLFRIYNHISLPDDEHVSVNVDVNRLLNYNNIGIILQIFTRTDTSNHLRRVANISIGVTKLTDNLASIQWNALIKELKQLKSNNQLFGSTKKFTYWHLMESS